MNAPECGAHSKRIIGLFPELLDVGGVQEAGRLTAAALDEIVCRRGWLADFLSLNDPPGPHSLCAARRTIQIRGFGRLKPRFFLSGVCRALFSSGSRAGIVLAAHPNLAVVAVWMQRAAPSLRTVVMAHGVEVWQPLASFRRRALVRASLVLAPSRDTAQKLMDVQHVPPEKVRTLAWPLNPDFLRMADAPSNLSLPPAFPSGRIILTVGRWAASERYKGVDELIRAVAQLRPAVPSLHLVAVGGGDDLSRLRELATGLGVADRVHFLEGLSREEIAACYARADLVALPSTGEGFGLVYLEAMAFAKSVVGVACGGTTDIVQDGVNGLLVPPGDAGALAQTLNRLIGDDPLRAELGRRGSGIVRQKYQFDLFRHELENILDDALRGSTLA
jgi:glycosyltransferase involved in cell wall biosynthesis